MSLRTRGVDQDPQANVELALTAALEEVGSERGDVRQLAGVRAADVVRRIRLDSDNYMQSNADARRPT
jgi:hypothetical protein